MLVAAHLAVTQGPRLGPALPRRALKVRERSRGFCPCARARRTKTKKKNRTTITGGTGAVAGVASPAARGPNLQAERPPHFIRGSMGV